MSISASTRPASSISSLATAVLAAGVLAACAAASPGIAPPAARPPAAEPAAPAPAPPLPEALLDRAGAFLGDREVVVLGTAQHGDDAIDRAASDLIRELVRDHGFRLVALEAAVAVGDRLGGDRDLPDAIDADLAFLLRPYRTTHVVELARWIRAWNVEHPDDPVRLVGLQPENPRRDLRTIAAALEGDDEAPIHLAQLERSLGPSSASDLALYVERARQIRGGNPLLPGTDREAALEALRRLEPVFVRRTRALVDGSGITRVAEIARAFRGLRAWIDVVDRYETEIQFGGGGDAKAFETRRRRAHGELERIRETNLSGVRTAEMGGAKAVAWTNAFSASGDSARLAVDGPFGQPTDVASVATRLASLGERRATVLVTTAAGAAPADPAAAAASELPERLGAFLAAADRGLPALVETAADRDRLADAGLDDPQVLALGPGPRAPRLRGLRLAGYDLVVAVPAPSPAAEGPSRTDGG